MVDNSAGSRVYCHLSGLLYILDHKLYIDRKAGRRTLLSVRDGRCAIADCQRHHIHLPSIHCLVSWFCYIGIRGRSNIPKAYRGFHAVNPVANDMVPMYKENTREYSLLKSRHFKTVLMMEVGALMVRRGVSKREAGFEYRPGI